MKKIITLAALIALATGNFALAGAEHGKKSCCGTCKTEAAVKACCTKDGSCKKDAEACTKKSAEKTCAEKASCTKK